METIAERVHRFCHDLRGKQAITRLRIEMALRAAANGDLAKVTRHLTGALNAIEDERALVDEREAEVAGRGAEGEGRELTAERLQAIAAQIAARDHLGPLATRERREEVYQQLADAVPDLVAEVRRLRAREEQFATLERAWIALGKGPEPAAGPAAGGEGG